jgi:hypothetical protein
MKNDLLKKSAIIGTIVIESGRIRCFDFGAFTAKMASEKGVFDFEKEYTARGGYFKEKERVELMGNDAIKFHITTQMKEIDMGEPPKYCPKGSGIVLTGFLNQTLNLEGQAKNTDEIEKYLNGKTVIKISRGSVRRFNILGKVFSILNVSQLFKLKFPDLILKGMPFEDFSGDCAIKDGIAQTDNFILDSEAIKILSVGKIDLVKDKVDLRLGVQPLQAIDKTINIIPLVGEILTGEDKSFLVAYFDVTGDIKNPKVTPSLISPLKEGALDIFKRVLRLPRKIVPQPSS